MKYGHTYFDLKENMEGCITDAMATNIQPSNKQDAGDIAVEMSFIPDIATITFDVELVNMTGSQHSRFIIDTAVTQPILDVHQTITNRQWTLSAVEHADMYFRLRYKNRTFRTAGEQVRIGYNGRHFYTFFNSKHYNNNTCEASVYDVMMVSPKSSKDDNWQNLNIKLKFCIL